MNYTIHTYAAALAQQLTRNDYFTKFAKTMSKTLIILRKSF